MAYQYYSIPAGSATAIGGHWEQGPGIGFFHMVRNTLGEKEIIAEDLGYALRALELVIGHMKAAAGQIQDNLTCGIYSVCV